MQPVSRALAALLISFFFNPLTARDAHAADFEHVVVFGDSLSDAGYFRPFLAGLGLPDPVVQTLGRFTTNPGPVWSERVSEHYGVQPAPSNAGGWIFAQGGATVDTASPSTPPGFAQRPVSTQISEYLVRNGSQSNRNTLFAVWAGGNDFLNNFERLGAGQISPEEFQANFLGAAQAEIQQVSRLFDAGGRYVMVFALPDFGKTPFALSAGEVAQAQASAAAVGYNLTLFDGLRTAGLRVIPVDVFSLFNELRATPETFGFTNTSGIACGPFPPITAAGSAQFCIADQNTVAPDAQNTYLFADAVHPTTGAHRVLADFVTALIEGPTAYSLLTEAPLAMRRSYLNAVSAGVAQGRSAPVGAFTPFASVSDGNFDLGKSAASDGLATSNRSYVAGVTVRPAEAVTVALTIGRARASGKLGGDLGRFKATELAYAAVVGVRHKGFYADAVGAFSDIDYSDIHRNIALGIATRVTQSSSDGYNAGFSIETGYDFVIDRLTVSPTLSWTAQTVKLDGFAEKGGGAAGLKIGHQERDSAVSRIGLRAAYDFGTITPYVHVSADEEHATHKGSVSVTPLSLATRNNYEIAGYEPSDSSYITTVVGLRGTLDRGIGYGLQYVKVSSRQDVSEDSISATLSIRF